MSWPRRSPSRSPLAVARSAWWLKAGAAVLVAGAVVVGLALPRLSPVWHTAANATQLTADMTPEPTPAEALPSAPRPEGPLPGGRPSAPVRPGACAPLADLASAGGMAITSLVHGRALAEGPSEASLVIVTRAEDLGLLAEAGAPAQLAGVDLTADVLIGLFVGRRPQGGHQVTVERVVPTDAGACVVARLTAPPPGTDAIDVETYPFHVVSVARAGVPLAPGTIWSAISLDGAPIAETALP